MESSLAAGSIAKARRRTSLNGCASGNTSVREQPEHRSTLWQVVVRGHPEVVDLVFCGGFGVLAMLPDVVEQALNQVVVQLLVAVLNEAKRVNIVRRPRLVAEVYRPCSNPHAMRNTQCFHWRSSDAAAVSVTFHTAHAFVPPALDFAFDLAIAEIPRIAFQQSDFMQPLRIFE